MITGGTGGGCADWSGDWVLQPRLIELHGEGSFWLQRGLHDNSLRLTWGPLRFRIVHRSLSVWQHWLMISSCTICRQSSGHERMTPATECGFLNRERMDQMSITVNHCNDLFRPHKWAFICIYQGMAGDRHRDRPQAAVHIRTDHNSPELLWMHLWSRAAPVLLPSVNGEGIIPREKCIRCIHMDILPCTLLNWLAS